MSEEIPDWCFELVMGLVNDEVGRKYWDKLETAKANAIAHAFARLIHKTQEEPVDPLVQAAREICASVVGTWLSGPYAQHYRMGNYDDGSDVQEVLKILQAIKGGQP